MISSTQNILSACLKGSSHRRGLSAPSHSIWQFITMASVIVYDFQGWIIKFDWCHTLLNRTQLWKVLATMWTAPHPRGYCGYKDQPCYQCSENNHHESWCDWTVSCCFKLSWFCLQTMSLEGEGVFFFLSGSNLVVITAQWHLK